MRSRVALESWKEMKEKLTESTFPIIIRTIS